MTDAFEMAEWDIARLQKEMQAGDLSSRDIVAKYLRRIENLNPTLRAVIEINPDALAIAEVLDAERRDGKLRGPLHGIPVLLKDNIATADAMETTAGSLALVGHKPPADAALVARLRAAGLVILGKSNLSEWANFRSSQASSGWSARGGQTRNPYVLDRSPCGSSSGSAVAVAANLSALAIGTETNGSIVCPAGANGIVGIKPSHELVPGEGIIPIAHSQDVAGPMARSVRDAALLLSALSGEDYSSSLDHGALRGARIGVWREKFGIDERTDNVMEASLEAMRKAGAELIDVSLSTEDAEFQKASFAVLLYEFKAQVASYLQTLTGDGPKSLADLMAFNRKNAGEELAYFGQEVFEQAAGAGELSDPAYLAAKELIQRKAGSEGIDKVIRESELDAIVAPTNTPAWPIDLLGGDRFIMGSSAPAAAAGYPHITVPAGQVHDLPVGISFFAGARSEARLIALAYAFEQATKKRRPPRLLPTLE